MRTFTDIRHLSRQVAVMAGLGWVIAGASADEKASPNNSAGNSANSESKDVPKSDAKDEKSDLAERRLQVMKARAEAIRFSSSNATVPKQLQPMPLFRYEDQTRGYVDGAVWRLGEQGRPLAVITTELHPNYLGEGPRIIYDFLSLTERPFTAKSPDVSGWSPRGSAATLQRLPDAPPPANAPAARLGQMKQLARRFTATQEVTELDKSFVHLRLLPREVDRYSPDANAESDGALFLFVNGRNPGVVLLLETNGQEWTYGVGRLSAPSALILRLDDTIVWKEPRASGSLTWSSPYTATNAAATFP
ncbi:MAG: hypothetical protein AABP62_29090 [Planctomycetota bacterium]